MEVDLCVQNHAVAFQQNGIAVGDEGLAFALDHNDNAQTGNVQIADTLAVPGVLSAEDDFLQVDGMVVVHGGGTQYQRVAHVELGVAAGDQYVVLTLDGGDDDAVGETARLDEIIGIMYGMTRKGKVWSADSKIWKLYSWFWMLILPVRRWPLGLWRRIFLNSR